MSAASSARQAVRTKGFPTSPSPSYAFLLDGEITSTSACPAAARMCRRYGAYCPNRHGPSAVGMNSTVRAGSAPGPSTSFMKSPTVTLAG